MANTQGGVILLGVEQDADGHFNPSGLRQPEKLCKTLFDDLNNHEVISASLPKNDDVQIIEYYGNHILYVRIPRATRHQRPVYVGSNPFAGTFRRNFEGDYHCDEVAVKRMLAEALDESRDSHLLEHSGLDDIDPESLAAYRNEFRSAKPGHPWLSLDDRELLRNLGGWHVDRATKQEGLTVAGLVMFGKQRSIWLLSMISFVPQEIIESLQERFGAKFAGLHEHERLALAIAAIEGRVTNQRLREQTSQHPTDVTALLHELVGRRFLQQRGLGRGTYYQLPDEKGQIEERSLFSDLLGQDLPAQDDFELLSDKSPLIDSEHLPSDSEHLEADSDDEMLQLIERIRNSGKIERGYVQEAILFICRENYITLTYLAEQLKRAPDTLRTHYISNLLQNGKLEARFPEKPNHPEQAYRMRT